MLLAPSAKFESGKPFYPGLTGLHGIPARTFKFTGNALTHQEIAWLGGGAWRWRGQGKRRSGNVAGSGRRLSGAVRLGDKPEVGWIKARSRWVHREGKGKGWIRCA